MNTADIAEKTAGSHDLSKATAKSITEAVFAAITEAAAEGQGVSPPGFGKFEVQDKSERDGRNPSTGETIKIEASKKLVFQPAKAAKDRLNP